MAVSVVSNSYALVQHGDVVELCLRGLELAGVDVGAIECEVGLTEYGEWMNLRLYLPKTYDYAPRDGHPLRLRLECFNSVDGSYRLVVYFGWYRFICANGMVIGETKAEVREIHNKGLDLDGITFQIAEAMLKVEADRVRLDNWAKSQIDQEKIKPWVDGALTEAWGKKAACRAYHICKEGFDVEIHPPFADGTASSKPVRQLEQVPGSAVPAVTAYDASQALTWLATGRSDPDERLKWMLGVPLLIDKLVDGAKLT